MTSLLKRMMFLPDIDMRKFLRQSILAPEHAILVKCNLMLQGNWLACTPSRPFKDV